MLGKCRQADPHEVIASSDGRRPTSRTTTAAQHHHAGRSGPDESADAHRSARSKRRRLTFADGKLWFTAEGSAISYDPAAKRWWILGTGQNRRT
jgi:hypothetical protein